MWMVRLSRQASKFIEAISGKHREQLESGLSVLAEDPFSGKPLKGDLKGYWSFRVGIYRMIYTIQRNEVIVEVLRIHHRKEVYDKLRRV